MKGLVLGLMNEVRINDGFVNYYLCTSNPAAPKNGMRAIPRTWSSSFLNGF